MWPIFPSPAASSSPRRPTATTAARSGVVQLRVLREAVGHPLHLAQANHSSSRAASSAVSTTPTFRRPGQVRHLRPWRRRGRGGRPAGGIGHLRAVDAVAWTTSTTGRSICRGDSATGSARWRTTVPLLPVQQRLPTHGGTGVHRSTPHWASPARAPPGPVRQRLALAHPGPSPRRRDSAHPRPVSDWVPDPGHPAPETLPVTTTVLAAAGGTDPCAASSSPAGPAPGCTVTQAVSKQLIRSSTSR
jgi:hypothetical protein